MLSAGTLCNVCIGVENGRISDCHRNEASLNFSESCSVDILTLERRSESDAVELGLKSAGQRMVRMSFLHFEL